MAKTLRDYRFTFNGVNVVYPCEGFQITWERYEDEIFYRKGISTLTFQNQREEGIFDFDTFWNLENSLTRCNFYDLDVDLLCGGQWEDIFDGNVHFVDGDWNVDDCTLKIDIRPNDKYSCITDNWQKAINVFDYVDLDERIELDALEGELEFKNCETEFETGGGSFLTLKEPVTNCIGNENIWWVLEHEGELVEQEKSWWDGIFGDDDSKLIERRKTNWIREKYTGVGVPTSTGWVEDNGSYYRKPLLFKVSETRDQFLGFRYKLVNEVVAKLFDNGIKLSKFMEVLARQTCGGSMDVKSKFFEINDVNDVGGGAYYYAKQFFSKCVVYQKTDIKYNNKDQNATSFASTENPLTLKKILDDLKVWANVYWDIEETESGDVLRIEHFSYWANLGDWDFTQEPMEKFIRGHHSYKYKTNQFPKSEIFKYMDSISDDFQGKPIEYIDGCVTNQKSLVDKVEACSYTTNDIAWMIANSEEIDDDGVVFVTANDDYTKIREDFITNQNKFQLNGAMSFYNLVPNLKLWNRPRKTGLVNGLKMGFFHSKPQREHQHFDIYTCCSSILEMTTKMKRTRFGWCQVEGIELSEPSGAITFKLEF